ncbi:protein STRICTOSIDINE SYNTHASE-LIKE 5-like [Oryza glaberrima]|uniref:Strictosidine synthase conserved region domain-containing protein n=2 Tax=Oryza TaxID=4527 RepID=A0A0D3HG72_9ORYZ|nr:protein STRICTOSIDINE SYNTHASE-LIKE 5-like [Oryza glaberrima]
MASSLSLLLAGVKAALVVLAGVALYSPEGFSPAPMPPEYSYGAPVSAPRHEPRALAASERVGEGRLPAPEDLAYDAAGGWLYTGCGDGWVRRVSVSSGDVEDWARTGGRPLGVALTADAGLVVADADIGLLKVSPDKAVELLTDEAEGVKFALTDGVDVAGDGVIYFTDASHKHSLAEFMVDVLEARPHGRLMSFDPSTRRTTVLARGLYFANGVAVSPDQDSLVFCETVMRRCSRYHINGDKAGTVDKFIGDLPGFPDNIRYDGEGRYWIAISAGRTLQWDVLTRSPFVRKLVYMVDRFVVAVPHNLKNAGAMSVTLAGEPVSMYSDPGLALTTGWLKVGDYLYYGSLTKPYLSRIDLAKSPAEKAQE